MRISRVSIVAVWVAVMSGCAFSTPPPVVVQPELIPRSTMVGSGTPLRVRISDERPSQSLGTRGVRGVGADVTVAADFPTNVQSAVMQGLRNQGFAPDASLPPNGRELHMEIRDLQYNVGVGF